MALGTQVVDLVRLDFLDDAGEVAAVGQITKWQMQITVARLLILINIVNTTCIEQQRTATDAVDDAAHLQQKPC